MIFASLIIIDNHTSEIMNDNIISELLENLDNIESLNLRLTFFQKRKNDYLAYNPNVDRIICDRLIGLIIEYLREKVDFRIVNYNPVRPCADDELESCEIAYVGNYNEVIECVENADYVNTNIDVNKLTFYRIDIINNDFRCSVFRRVTKFKRLSAQGILAIFNGDTLNTIDEQLLGIDGCIDLLCINDRFFIFNHIALERIFRLNVEFEQRARYALESIARTNKIINFQQFESACIDNARYHKALSRLVENEIDPNVVFNNFDEVESVIDSFNLDIECSGIGNERQIVYSDASQIMDIIRIISDAYCKSIICSRNLVYDN